jgi:hypothetical protein
LIPGLLTLKPCQLYACNSYPTSTQTIPPDNKIGRAIVVIALPKSTFNLLRNQDPRTSTMLSQR